MIVSDTISPPTSSKLSIQHVSKSFGKLPQITHALQDISLDIKEKEFVCFVGPSGCGKSTLLNIIAGLTMPDSGTVLLNNQPLTDQNKECMMMFQEHALFPWLDVLGNVMFPLKLIEGLSRSDRKDLAMNYLKLVKLDNVAHSHIHELSGGMKQRVALARALAPNPKVLLMDEPFAALDAMTREQLYGDIQEIHMNTGKTIVFVTHNIREAACLGDRILLFSPNPGRIIREYDIDISRPRDINDGAISKFAMQITADLKNKPTTCPADE